MTRKNKQDNSLAPVTPAVVEIVHEMNGSGGLVRVDAVYHVPKVHPSGDGLWVNEADKVAWTDPMTGYGCIIRRSPNGGHLCGYVSVPPAHPLFGRQVGSLVGLGIGVHGGLDYSAECEQNEAEERSVCHVVKRIVPHGFQQRVHANQAATAGDDAWWLGFSCDKPDDIVPLPDSTRTRMAVRLGFDTPTYKTEGFVHGECVRLAAQLKAIEEGRDPQEADPGPTPVGQSGRELDR